MCRRGHRGAAEATMPPRGETQKAVVVSVKISRFHVFSEGLSIACFSKHDPSLSEAALIPDLLRRRITSGTTRGTTQSSAEGGRRFRLMGECFQEQRFRHYLVLLRRRVRPLLTPRRPPFTVQGPTTCWGSNMPLEGHPSVPALLPDLLSRAVSCIGVPRS